MRLFQFKENRGNRDAMALGAREAHGEILVYLDSDSFMDPDGVYKLVQPFKDPRIRRGRGPYSGGGRAGQHDFQDGIRPLLHRAPDR